jgi:hypothetical protein
MIRLLSHIFIFALFEEKETPQMKKVNAILLAVGLLCVASRANAGARDVTFDNVIVFAGPSGTAIGAMGGARNRPDSNQEIGCSLYWQGTGVGLQASCFAKDASGNVGYCSSTDPAMMQMLATINSDSLLEFSWDVQGRCFKVVVTNGSQYAPKLP